MNRSAKGQSVAPVAGYAIEIADPSVVIATQAGAKVMVWLLVESEIYGNNEPHDLTSGLFAT